MGGVTLPSSGDLDPYPATDAPSRATPSSDEPGLPRCRLFSWSGSGCGSGQQFRQALKPAFRVRVVTHKLHLFRRLSDVRPQVRQCPPSINAQGWLGSAVTGGAVVIITASRAVSLTSRSCGARPEAAGAVRWGGRSTLRRSHGEARPAPIRASAEFSLANAPCLPVRRLGHQPRRDVARI